MNVRSSQRPAMWLRVAIATLSLTACESLVTTPVPYGTVRVEAVSRSGVPIQGIRAEVYRWDRPMGYQLTDDAGRASFDRIPRGDYGVFMLLPEGVDDISRYIAAPVGTVVNALPVKAGSDTTLRFVFSRRGPGPIEARVRSTGGDLLEGVPVTFYSTSGIVGTRRSNAQGIARIDSVPSGAYGAFAQPPDSLGIRGAPLIFRDGLLVDRDVVPRAEFSVPTCYGTITVRARDQANAAIVGATIQVYTSRAVVRTALTDAAGNVSFTRLPCDGYGVVIVPHPPGYAVNTSRGSGLQDGLFITSGAVLTVTLRATKL